MYENTGAGFTEAYPGSLPGVGGSSVDWGDYDNDGDLDILLTGNTTSGYTAKVYQNTGAGFTAVHPGSLTGVNSSSVDWGDYDNDGDLDILLTGYYGSRPTNTTSKVYRNDDCVPALTLSKAVTPTTNVAYHGLVTYTVVLRDTGGADDAHVVLTDTLPSAVDFGAWIENPGANVSGDEITWNGVVTASSAVTFTFTAQHTGAYGDIVTNTAKFSGTLQAASAGATFGVMWEPNARINGTDCNLIDAITAANTDTATGACAAGTPGADTITLLSDVTLTSINNEDNGLPVIGSPITIEGGDHTITRAVGAPEFRIVQIASTGALTLNATIISGGYLAMYGGGLYNLGALTLNDSTASGNSAYGSSGGGVFNGNTGVAILNHSTVSGNWAGNGGGVNNLGTLTLNTSTVTGNRANLGGGGIANQGNGVAMLNGSTIISNAANGDQIAPGGGILNYAVLTVTNSTISGNSANGEGGGLYNDETTAVALVTNSTVSNNTAGISNTPDNNSGGGLSNGRVFASMLTLVNTTVTSNTATGNGGGVSNGAGAGAVTVTNSTVTSNTATGNGGGVSNAVFGQTTLERSLIAGNSADIEGDEVYNGVMVMSLDEAACVAFGGTYDSGTGLCTFSGTVNDNGYNLFGHSGNAGVSGFGFSTGDIVPSQALAGILGPLADNGGGTLTHALPSNSPAIDAGDPAVCPATDQRGQARDDWRCDIGAYELRLSDSATVVKAITGPGTYTFGPTLVKLDIGSGEEGTLNSVTVTRTVGDHSGRTGASNHGVGWGEYWTLTPNDGATFTVSLTLPTLFTPDVYSKVCRFISGTTWDCAVGISSTVPFTTITRSGVTGFSEWAVGKNVGPLAITLNDFAVTANTSSGIIGAALAAFAALGVLLIGRRRLKGQDPKGLRDL